MNHSERYSVTLVTRTSLHDASGVEYRPSSVVVVSRRCLKRACSVVAILASFVTLSSNASAFVSHRAISSRSKIALHAKATSTKTATKVKTAESGVMQLQPKTSIPENARQIAVDAMRADVEVNAKMLDLLSESFLASTAPPPLERPLGRPPMVVGAMNYDTLHKFKELSKKKETTREQFSSVAPYTDGEGIMQNPQIVDPTMDEVPAKRKKGTVKGTSTSREGLEGGEKDLPIASKKVDQSKTKKKKKNSTKSLPQARNPGEVRYEESKISRKVKRKVAGANNVDLSLYYRTVLLNAEEEYTLGMKVRLMVKCEEVHEGLSKKLARLPTFDEWAKACGFVEEDQTFVPTLSDQQLRPAGSESKFEEIDPYMFSGSGLACTIGVGRGRGRVQKAPPTEMTDFFDDSANKFREPGAPRIPKTPINRGTVTDFVDMLMEGNLSKQRMVSSNMRLVVCIAKKYCNDGINLQDLVQEGSLGLTRAAEMFEPKRGFKFSTYASWWIQQAVFRSIAHQSRTIRLPVHIHHLLNRVRRVRKSLESQLGRGPTNEEIAFDLEMPLQRYNKMMLLTRRCLSLETPKFKQNPKDFGHEGEDVLGDTIAGADTNYECSPEKGVDRTLFHEDLRDMLKTLEHDERRVISARYGLDDGMIRTVTAVSAQMQQPKAWVRSQESRGLRKLRRPWYEKRLKEHQESLGS